MTATTEKAGTRHTAGGQVFAKNALEQVRVERTTFRGREYVNARIWFQDERGEWRPTQKGLALTPELAEQVARAMLEVAGE